MSSINVEKRSKKQIDTGAVLTTFIALLCMGKPDFESVAELQNDAAFYQTALHLKRGFLSAATLRQRMDAIGKSQRDALLQFNTHLLKSNGIEPTPLKNGMVPVDMDVTPMDNSNTKKEGVSWTYKKFMGYAPMMAYIGKEGYLANVELREGKQHCQSGTPDFLRQTIKICKASFLLFLRKFQHNLLPRLFRAPPCIVFILTADVNDNVPVVFAHHLIRFLLRDLRIGSI